MGRTDVAGAARLVDLCLDAGLNMLDTADVYFHGLPKEFLGNSVAGKRGRLLLVAKEVFAVSGDDL